MLLNILPGFRELRAPLAAGYVWLLAGWLAFGGSVSIPEEAQDFLEQFSAIGEAAALSFAAYIVGAFVSDGLAPLWERLRKYRLKGRVWRWRNREWSRISAARPSAIHLNDSASSEAGRALGADFLAKIQRDEMITRRVEITYRYAPEPISIRGMKTIASLRTRTVSDVGAEMGPGPAVTEGQAESVLRELDIARFRLLSQERDLFNEVDRLQGEGRFRLALAAPLAALAVTLATTENFVWLAALLPIAALAWQGMDRLEESGDRVADALRAGKVKVPALEGVGAADERPTEEQPLGPTSESLQPEGGENSVAATEED